MPSESEQKKNRQAMMDALGKLPVPVPGSSAGIFDIVRKAIMETDKKKKKKPEGEDK